MDAVNEPQPPSQTPKKLGRQAAEKIAFHLVSKCQPALISYLFNPDDKVKEMQIMYLKGLKMLFWDNKYGLVEPYRRLISDVITDVTELQSYKNKNFPSNLQNLMNTQTETRAPFMLVMFATQVLFTYGAGYANAMDMFKLIVVRSNASKVLARLLEAVKPFNLEKLSTAFIRFVDPAPLLTLLENSPLKHIYLVNNISISIFNTIRAHCKDLETIYFKMFPHYVVPTNGSMQNFLFETFFEGQGMEAVIQSLDAEEKLPRTFPYLKEVQIDNNSVNISVPANEFMYCLQHLYPNVATRWFTYINVSKPSSKLCMSSFKVQSPFLRRGKHNWDVVTIGYISDMELIDDQSETDGYFPSFNHIVIEVDTALNKEFKEFIEGLTIRHQCKRLELVLYKPFSGNPEILSSVFDKIGSSLQVLILNLPYGLFVDEIIGALNVCCSLQMLAIEANYLEYEKTLSPFNSFLKLSSLTVNIHPQVDDKSRTATQTLIVHLIAAAPYVKTLKLSSLSDEAVDRIRDFKNISEITTFQIGSPFPKNLMQLIDKFPMLSVLILNYEYWRCNHHSENIYFMLRKAFQHTSLSVLGIGKTPRFTMKQCYEFFR